MTDILYATGFLVAILTAYSLGLREGKLRAW